MKNSTVPDRVALNLLADRLIHALRTRKRIGGKIFVLDLRGDDWENIGLVIVRQNTGARWPKKGPTTTRRREAEEWVRDYYPAWVYAQLKVSGKGKANITVTDACDQYIASLEEGPVEGNSTLINRRSVCNVHLKPAFGTRVFRQVTTEDVQSYLQRMQVTKSVRGTRSLKPAEMTTRANVRTALLAVWHHVFGSEPPPFAGARSRDPHEHWRRTEAANAGTLQEELEDEAYSREEVARILAAATWYDARYITGKPNVAVRVVPNSTALVAVLVGTGARISEVLRIRWKNVDWNRNAIFIPGSKTLNAPRWIPLQKALVPWLRWLQAQQGGNPEPDTLVFRARPTDPYRRMGCRTAQSRMSRILRFAGKKRPGASTHIMRATHSTWAVGRIKRVYLKLYLGHSQPVGGVTDRYIKFGPNQIPPAHRGYLSDHLPSRLEVDAELRVFEPDCSWLRPSRATAA